MAQGSSFWQWYAQVNDDIRHHLVDRAWHVPDQRVNAFEQHVNDMAKRADGQEPEQAVVYTHNPHVPEAFEGIGARGSDEFNAEHVKNVMAEYYGHGKEPEPKSEAEQTRERDEAIKKFYRTPEQNGPEHER